jgi:hypothetical protein
MQTVIGQPPRAGPGTASPAPTRRTSFSTWLVFVQRTLQQAGRQGKHCLASCAESIRPGPPCAYTMLVASDIKKDAYGVEF